MGFIRALVTGTGLRIPISVFVFNRGCFYSCVTKYYDWVLCVCLTTIAWFNFLVQALATPIFFMCFIGIFRWKMWSIRADFLRQYLLISFFTTSNGVPLSRTDVFCDIVDHRHYLEFLDLSKSTQNNSWISIVACVLPRMPSGREPLLSAVPSERR